MDYYCELKDRFQKIIKDHNINTELEIVKVQKLTPKEAIGDTGREDYPILKGKELLINAYYKGSVGQAFTDNAKNFQGSLRDVLSLDLEDESNVPIFIATLNAVLRDLGLIKNTIHCKDGEPKKCSEKILEFFKDEYKDKKIVLVGLQPAMLEILSKDFDVRVLDLDVDNVGKERFGVIIEDGIKDYFDVIN
ncbi:MAG: hypothetical protein RR645_02590, partial [Clostridium sp.]